VRYQLDKTEWQGMELAPVKKDFYSYIVHRDVAERDGAHGGYLRLQSLL